MTSKALDAEALRLAFRSISQSMRARSEELRALDAACGDGDLGITVTKGFTAIENALDALQGETPAHLLQSLGMAFSNAAASTFGVLFSTAFQYAGKSVEGKLALEASDLCAMLEAASKGIAMRGRAKPGDRTILDALVPAHEAARQAMEKGEDCRGLLSAAAEAAKTGAEKTRDMAPKVGRARWLAKEPTGFPDAGAMFVHFFLVACDTAVSTLVGDR